MRYRVYLMLVDRSKGLLQITAGFKSMASTCWGVLLEVSFYWFVASHIASFHIPRCDFSPYSKTQCLTSSDPAMIWIQHWKQGTFCGLALPQTPAVVMVWRRWWLNEKAMTAGQHGDMWNVNRFLHMSMLLQPQGLRLKLSEMGSKLDKKSL